MKGNPINNVTINGVDMTKSKLEARCLVCGESVPIDMDEIYCAYRICDKCKRAILKMRKNMEGEEL